MSQSDYNYAVFPPEDDVDAFAGFSTHLPVGDFASDSVLTRLQDRRNVRLSEITRQGLTIIEFGSLT